MNQVKMILNVIGWAGIFAGAGLVSVAATEGTTWAGVCVASIVAGMLINTVAGMLPRTKPSFHTYKVTLRNIETGMIWDVTVRALDKDGLISRVRGQYETDYVKPVSATRID